MLLTCHFVSVFISLRWNNFFYKWRALWVFFCILCMPMPFNEWFLLSVRKWVVPEPRGGTREGNKELILSSNSSYCLGRDLKHCLTFFMRSNSEVHSVHLFGGSKHGKELNIFHVCHHGDLLVIEGVLWNHLHSVRVCNFKFRFFWFCFIICICSTLMSRQGCYNFFFFF